MTTTQNKDHAIRRTKRSLEAALTAVKASLQMVTDLEQKSDKNAIHSTIALIRKRGGKGGVSKIEADPELRAFVLEHIYTLTYQQISDKVAQKFPPDRRTSVSALSRWWRSQDEEAL